MNYSQDGYDCTGGRDCQSIFFATSKDALSWKPVAPDAQKRAKTTSSRRQPRRAQPERGVDIIDERTGKTIKYTGDLVTSPDRIKSGRASERCMRMRTPAVGPEEEGADEEGAA